MPIPKAAPGDEFSYYFQYAVFTGEEDDCAVFLDSFRYSPLFPVIRDRGTIFISPEDLTRIYSPYFSLSAMGDSFMLSYGTPRRQKMTIFVPASAVRRDEDTVRLNLIEAMDVFQMENYCGSDLIAVSIDAPENQPIPYESFSSRKYYCNILAGKDKGEQNFTIWNEEAKRLLPYRMYIPFSYEPGSPMRTLVCFHGGDANCDYMFKLTDGEIERYAEKRGYILLALTSPWKYTFFGGSRRPTGSDCFDPALENPLELTDEELARSLIAERSVMAQIEDAGRRYYLDPDAMYALGNSGGSLGIFHQIQSIQIPFFSAAACSGGVQNPDVIDYEAMKAAGTSILLVMSSEDIFDGQYTGRVAFPRFMEEGIDVELTVVGGGEHLTGWTHALTEIFDYFEAH